MPTTRFHLAFLTLLLAAAGCVSPESYRREQSANAALRAQLADLSEHQRQLNLENERLRSDVDRLGKSAADAAWIKEQKEKLDRLLRDYQEGGGSLGPVEGVELVRTPEGIAFRVLGELLFASGKADVTDAGRQTLMKLVATLKQEGRRIRVDGHTDDEPIQHSAWGTNLKLSVARALAVADFLIQNGVPAEKVAVAGYGEYRPAVAGGGDGARQKNRRVEILMLDG